MTQRYTRREVGRILGLDARRLRYWERLQLVRPQARWGERFYSFGDLVALYSFGDLVALRSIKRLTENHIPALRVRRAVRMIEQQFRGGYPLPLQELRFLEQGRDVLVIPPGETRPFNPMRQQWAFLFDDGGTQALKLRPMTGPTPEQLFEAAMNCEAKPESLPLAVENYERALELAPDWIDAHINKGVALYQMGRIDEAREAFFAAVQLDPLNGISRYNLGCVLEEQGEFEDAIRHLRRAAKAMPAHADVHFNLALAYERKNERRLAREQWALYLRYAPTGPWADQARARLKQYGPKQKSAEPIPFRRPN
ncbi:MAG: tetratricopeptide repeat protein [Candidatus Acidiferrales bacterium]